MLIMALLLSPSNQQSLKVNRMMGVGGGEDNKVGEEGLQYTRVQGQK